MMTKTISDKFEINPDYGGDDEHIEYYRNAAGHAAKTKAITNEDIKQPPSNEETQEMPEA